MAEVPGGAPVQVLVTAWATGTAKAHEVAAVMSDKTRAIHRAAMGTVCAGPAILKWMTVCGGPIIAGISDYAGDGDSFRVTINLAPRNRRPTNFKAC